MLFAPFFILLRPFFVVFLILLIPFFVFFAILAPLFLILLITFFVLFFIKVTPRFISEISFFNNNARRAAIVNGSNKAAPTTNFRNESRRFSFATLLNIDPILESPVRFFFVIEGKESPALIILECVFPSTFFPSLLLSSVFLSLFSSVFSSS